ncbi:MAG: tyrosine-type recombinase/integrase [Gammaproteobacteria bacterium]|nr:tyrosine-type recombinase/integrase [Gammaproteobacteria bacterium]
MLVVRPLPLTRVRRPVLRVRAVCSRVLPLNGISPVIPNAVRERRTLLSFSGSELLMRTYHGHSMTMMNNSAWQAARVRVGMTQVRVHDLKHTFGRRLRAAGVSFEDRQDLLRHKSGRITTHYSAA